MTRRYTSPGTRSIASCAPTRWPLRLLARRHCGAYERLVRIQLYPQVFAEDVVAGLSEQELLEGEVQLSAFVEYVPDVVESRAETIVRALLRPGPREGTLE